MTEPTRGTSTLTALLMATAAVAAAAAPAAAADGPADGSPFGPVRATVAGHVLRGESAAPRSAAGTTAPLAATTGSIVFVKGGNVWLTRPDGTGMRQVTR